MSSADTRTELTSRARHPLGSVNAPHHVTVELTFDGVAYTPEDLFDALETLYGTVEAQHEGIGPNHLQLRISA
jgi:hypothetical protein